MSVVLIEDLAKYYGRRVGVDGLNLSVQGGSLFGFLGPNGAGKSTIIRVLLGLLRPDRGWATIFDLDCWRYSARIKEDIGYVPGDLRLYPWLTCRIAIKILGRVRRRDLDANGQSLANEFSLEPDVPVRQMSRGMRQKLGLILALAHEPTVLVLDEPSTGLDPLIQDRLFERLRAMTADGHTVFFSSHTLSEVEQLCDRVAIVRKGRIVACDDLDALRSRAPREVTLVWKPDARHYSETPPAIMNLTKREGRRWSGTLNGGTVEFVRWCAGQPIEDVTIGAPDLAALFRGYYQEADEESPCRV